MRDAHRWTIVAALCPMLMVGVALTAQDDAPRTNEDAARERAQSTRFLAQGLTTLYASDPIARVMSFSTGEYGSVIQDHMVKNRNSDIDFCGYVQDAFTVGIEGGRTGAIVDLGRASELGRRHGFVETVGGGQAYASIRFVGEELHILGNYQTQTTQPLEKARWLVPQETQSAPVRPGHIYLVRLADRNDAAFELVAKVLVVEYRPGESVTLRWQRLR